MLRKANMRQLAMLLAALALGALFFALTDPSGRPYFKAILTGALGALAWVASDVARFRRANVDAPFEVGIGRVMFCLFAITGAPLIVAVLDDPELIALGIFVGAFALFGTVFRFGFGRLDTSGTPEGRARQRRKNLTGKLNWSGDRIEDMAAETRMSPWPARGLLAFGLPLAATTAWGFSAAAIAGLAMTAAGLGLMALRAKSMPHGRSFIAPNEAPFHISNGIGGGLVMTRPPRTGVTVSLSCVKRTLRKGDDGRRSVDVETLWEDDMRLADGAFGFKPPADLPPSAAHGDAQVAWTLTATGEGYRAIFRLPVLP